MSEKPVGGTEQKGTCNLRLLISTNAHAHPHVKRPDCKGWQPLPSQSPTACIHGDDPEQCISCRMLAKRPDKVPPVAQSPTACPDALLPDGEICPRCGKLRAPSGVDGGSWVHVDTSADAVVSSEYSGGKLTKTTLANGVVIRPKEAQSPTEHECEEHGDFGHVIPSTHSVAQSPVPAGRTFNIVTDHKYISEVCHEKGCQYLVLTGIIEELAEALQAMLDVTPFADNPDTAKIHARATELVKARMQ